MVVCVLFWFCTHLRHIDFNFSLGKIRCPAFLEMDALSIPIPLRADSPQCICLYRLHYEPRMDSRMILVLISGNC